MGVLVMGYHRRDEYEVFSKVTVAMVSISTTFVITSLIWAYFGSCN